jgi:hypothetical protein
MKENWHHKYQNRISSEWASKRDHNPGKKLQERKNKKNKLITKHWWWITTTKDWHRRRVTGRISKHDIQIWGVGCTLQ